MSTFRSRPGPLSLALGVSLGGLAPLTGNALSITNISSFSGSASVTDTCTVASTSKSCGNGATSLAAPTLATPALTQFDSNLGVLTGTTLGLTSTRTQTISGSLSAGAKNKTSTTGAGTSNATVSAPGAIQTLGTISVSGTAKVPNTKGATTASFGPTSDAGTATNATLSVASGSLDSYVGGGTVTANLTAPTLQANSTWANTGKTTTKSSSTATYKLDWGGKLAVEYDYLLHAAPSFDGGSQTTVLDIDFGTFFLGNTASPLNFGIFDLIDPDRIGLDLDSIIGSGDTGILTTDLSTFSNLGQGGSSGFSAFFDTSGLGMFSASYQLDLSDADLGASSTLFNYSLTLNLTGNVIPIPVPEPTTWSLVVLGLAGVGLTGRRRRDKS